jgi:hypothetical protein
MIRKRGKKRRGRINSKRIRTLSQTVELGSTGKFYNRQPLHFRSYGMSYSNESIISLTPMRKLPSKASQSNLNPSFPLKMDKNSSRSPCVDERKFEGVYSLLNVFIVLFELIDFVCLCVKIY